MPRLLRLPFPVLLVATLSLAACGGDDSSTPATGDAYEYTAADVRAVAAGDFKGAATLAGRPSTTLDLHLDHAPPGAQPSCGNRELTHPLCVSTSSMRLTGTLSTADKSFEQVAVTASFDVYGEKLTQGALRVTAGATTFSFPWANGAFGAGTVSDASGAIGKATIGR
ncbi:MAG: hypothetical protein IT374_22965 [Polyangiaceae bacterium]|nr:hypothetical protein [Polyangiaceae bacterium]